MNGLRWQDQDGSLFAEGYELTRRDDGTWCLHSPPANLRRPSRVEREVTTHRSSAEAMAWAASAESDATRRLAASLHLGLAIAALGAFVLLSAEIGSLLGLGMLAAAFYVMLRSAANSIALRLRDAWGWTRLGHQRVTLLERSVEALARRIRSRWAEVAENAAPGAVVPLEPHF